MSQAVAPRWLANTWRASFFYNSCRTWFIEIIEREGKEGKPSGFIIFVGWNARPCIFMSIYNSCNWRWIRFCRKLFPWCRVDGMKFYSLYAICPLTSLSKYIPILTASMTVITVRFLFNCCYWQLRNRHLTHILIIIPFTYRNWRWIYDFAPDYFRIHARADGIKFHSIYATCPLCLSIKYISI